jgi:hypothetical protein
MLMDVDVKVGVLDVLRLCCKGRRGAKRVNQEEEVASD